MVVGFAGLFLGFDLLWALLGLGRVPSTITRALIGYLAIINRAKSLYSPIVLPIGPSTILAI